MTASELADLYRSTTQRNADLFAGRDTITLQTAQDIETQGETFLAFLRAANKRASDQGADFSEDVDRIEDTLSDITGLLMQVFERSRA